MEVYIMKHSLMNHILALNNPYEIDIPLNKLNQIEMIMIIIKHSWMNQIWALNNPYGIDMLLNE